MLPILPSAMKRAERALTGPHKNCRVWNFESQAAVSRFNQLCLCSSLFTCFVILGTAHGRENQRTTGALALDDSVKRSRVAMFTRPANDSASIFRITLPRWNLTVISVMPSSPLLMPFTRFGGIVAGMVRAQSAPRSSGSLTPRRPFQ